MIGDVGDATIPGTAVPAGSAPTRGCGGFGSGSTRGAGNTQHKRWQSRRSKPRRRTRRKQNHNQTSPMTQECANGPTDEAAGQLADVYGINASKLRVAMREAMGSAQRAGMSGEVSPQHGR